jgi:hypothetical protein
MLEEKMDVTCKKAFLIIFGIPAVLFLIAGWILLGGEKIKGEWFDGIFNDFSLMLFPTILLIIAGGIIDRFLFNSSLLNCWRKKSIKK